MDNFANILTSAEAMTALDLDAGSFDSGELADLIQEASAFVYRRTLYDWGSDNPVQPLAKSCCKLYLKQTFFGDSAHDYQKSIDLMIADLNDMVAANATEEQSDDGEQGDDGDGGDGGEGDDNG